jgi:hypothetical protein
MQHCPWRTYLLVTGVKPFCAYVDIMLGLCLCASVGSDGGQEETTAYVQEE